MGLSLKFQITAILPELTVYDNLLLALQAHRPVWSSCRGRRSTAARLDWRPTTSKAYGLAGEMSHGEQQWLQMLLLDEPTSGMARKNGASPANCWRRSVTIALDRRARPRFHQGHL